MYIESTQKILEKGGWYEGRKIKMKVFIEVLEEYEGEFSLIAAATNFYEEWGELNFDFFNTETRHPEKLVFDVAEATSLLFPGDVTEEYLPLISSKHLIPVGYWNDASKIIFIDENSSLYVGADKFFEKLGNTPQQAMDNIFNRIALPLNN